MQGIGAFSQCIELYTSLILLLQYRLNDQRVRDSKYKKNPIIIFNYRY
jgi:hypothetical protein